MALKLFFYDRINVPIYIYLIDFSVFILLLMLLPTFYCDLLSRPVDSNSIFYEPIDFTGNVIG